MIKKVQSTKYIAQRGVTMVELLIYIGLLTLFLTVLTSLFVSIFKLQFTTQSTSSLTQDTRFIIARMGYDIENAKSISSPVLGQPPSDSLTFIDTNGNSFTYELDASNNLTLDGPSIPNGTNTKINGLDTTFSAISFQMIGTQLSAPATSPPPTVQVKFTINSNVIEQSGPRSQTIQTTYGLR